MTKTRVISKRGLVLSVSAAEKFCSLDFSKFPESKDRQADLTTPQLLKDEQADIALQLSNIFSTGTEDVNRDEFKAYKYLTRGTSSTDVEESLASAFTIYYLFGLFTTIRLLLVRLNRVLSVPFIGVPFLKTWFTFLSFSYLPELIFDVLKTSREAYQAMPEETELTGFAWLKDRFNHFTRCFSIALNQDPARKKRMANAALWGPLNVLLFVGVTLALLAFFPPGVFIALNILGFTFDLAVEIDKKADDIKGYEENEKELTKKIEPLEIEERAALHKIAKFEKRQQELSLEYKNEPNIARKAKIEIALKNVTEDLVKEQKNLTDIRSKLSVYTHQRTVVNNKIKDLKEKRNFEIALVGIILVGVILYSIPGLNIAMLIGSSLAFAVSVFYLQRKLRAMASSTHKLVTKKEDECLPEEANTTHVNNDPQKTLDDSKTLVPPVERQLSIPSITEVPSSSTRSTTYSPDSPTTSNAASMTDSPPEMYRQQSGVSSSRGSDSRSSSITSSPEEIHSARNIAIERQNSLTHSLESTESKTLSDIKKIESPNSPISNPFDQKQVLKSVEESESEEEVETKQVSLNTAQDQVIAKEKNKESLLLVNAWLLRIANMETVLLPQVFLKFSVLELRQARRILGYINQAEWNMQVYICSEFSKNKTIDATQIKDHQNRFFYGTFTAALKAKQTALELEEKQLATNTLSI